MAKARSIVGWKILTYAISIPAGIATRRAVARLWTSIGPADRGKPPRSPSDPNATLREAIIWTTISAAGVAVAENVTTRGAAVIWRNLIGGDPPPARTRD
jgi:Protein of unknown function (DUF4235)